MDTENVDIQQPQLSQAAAAPGMPPIITRAQWGADESKRNRGPVFLRAYCTHPEGHFLGDPLVRVARHPVKEMSQMTGPLLRSVAKKGGAPAPARADALSTILSSIKEAIKRQSTTQDDPILRARQELASQEARLEDLEQQVEREIEQIVTSALAAPEPDKEVGP